MSNLDRLKIAILFGIGIAISHHILTAVILILLYVCLIAGDYIKSSEVDADNILVKTHGSLELAVLLFGGSIGMLITLC